MIPGNFVFEGVSGEVKVTVVTNNVDLADEFASMSGMQYIHLIYFTYAAYNSGAMITSVSCTDRFQCCMLSA